MGMQGLRPRTPEACLKHVEEFEVSVRVKPTRTQQMRSFTPAQSKSCEKCGVVMRRRGHSKLELTPLGALGSLQKHQPRSEHALRTKIRRTSPGAGV
jgi:hypothetical protein